MFNGCYHGTVDDVFVDLVNGEPAQRASLLGQVHELTTHTAVVEFNDLDALARELAMGDVACVLAEPAMTNIGMVLPEPGYWPAAQALMRQHGTALQRLLDGADVDMANFRPRGSGNIFVANIFLWGPGFFTSAAFMMAAVVERLLTASFEPPGGAEASRLAP